MSKQVLIRRGDGTPIGHVDEHTSLAHMRAECAAFFRSPCGKRETITVHRGQLVARGTVRFTGCRPTRKTVVYLYFRDGELKDDTLCVSTGDGIDTVAKAKVLIDRILDSGTYQWGEP